MPPVPPEIFYLIARASSPEVQRKLLFLRPFHPHILTIRYSDGEVHGLRLEILQHLLADVSLFFSQTCKVTFTRLHQRHIRNLHVYAHGHPREVQLRRRFDGKEDVPVTLRTLVTPSPPLILHANYEGRSVKVYLYLYNPSNEHEASVHRARHFREAILPMFTSGFMIGVCLMAIAITQNNIEWWSTVWFSFATMSNMASAWLRFRLTRTVSGLIPGIVSGMLFALILIQIVIHARSRVVDGGDHSGLVT